MMKWPSKEYLKYVKELLEDEHPIAEDVPHVEVEITTIPMDPRDTPEGVWREQNGT